MVHCNGQNSSSHFLPKNDMILPCPGLAAPFLAALLVAGAGVGLAFFGAGSSSEKDSQAASSRVTVASQYRCTIRVVVLCFWIDLPRYPSSSFTVFFIIILLLPRRRPFSTVIVSLCSSLVDS